MTRPRSRPFATFLTHPSPWSMQSFKLQTRMCVSVFLMNTPCHLSTACRVGDTHSLPPRHHFSLCNPSVLYVQTHSCVYLNMPRR